MGKVFFNCFVYYSNLFFIGFIIYMFLGYGGGAINYTYFIFV